MSGVEVASATARIRKLTELNSKDLAGKIACVRVDGISPEDAPELAVFKIRGVLPAWKCWLRPARERCCCRTSSAGTLLNQIAMQQLFCRQLALHSGIQSMSSIGSLKPKSAKRSRVFLKVRLSCSHISQNRLRRRKTGLNSRDSLPAFAISTAWRRSRWHTRCWPLPWELRRRPDWRMPIQFERIFEDLRAILSDPERPLVAILGGALSLNKLLLAERIAARADTVLVGGELALAFHKAAGLPIGAASVPQAVAAEAAARVLRDMKARAVNSAGLPNCGRSRGRPGHLRLAFRGEGGQLEARASRRRHRHPHPAQLERVPASLAHRTLARSPRHLRDRALFPRHTCSWLKRSPGAPGGTCIKLIIRAEKA